MALGNRPIATAPIGGIFDGAIHARTIPSGIPVSAETGNAIAPHGAIAIAGGISETASVATAVVYGNAYSITVGGVSSEASVGGHWLLSDNYLVMSGLSAGGGCGSAPVRMRENADVAVGSVGAEAGAGSVSACKGFVAGGMGQSPAIGGITFVNGCTAVIRGISAEPGINGRTVVTQHQFALDAVSAQVGVGRIGLRDSTLAMHGVAVNTGICFGMVVIQHLHALDGIGAESGIGTAPACKVLIVSGQMADAQTGTVTPIIGVSQAVCAVSVIPGIPDAFVAAYQVVAADLYWAATEHTGRFDAARPSSWQSQNNDITWEMWRNAA